ncbi:hypothetical protein [Marinoscillum sp.]|uniref:hypothetical protein n=1 Tax=Marinoscillum sp. TaxID=2024838 RepID=UPI003BA8E9F3
MYRYIFILLILTACHPDKDKQVDSNELNFNTSDASELFFKNVRKSDYELEERQQAGLELYSKMGLKMANDMEPVIVLNWRSDLAYFYFNTNDSIETEMVFSIDSDRLVFEPGNHRNHAELARKLYNAVLSKQTILLNNQGFFESAEQANEFRRMFFDYLRLVDIR